MEAQKVADLTTMNEIERFKESSNRLQLEGFKIETALKMMNNCADRCELRYYESGVSDDSKHGVACFKNCVSKSYKLGFGKTE